MHKLSRLFSNCHFEFFLFNWLAFFSCGQIHLSISRRIWPVPQGYGWASHVIKITLKVGHRGLMVMALDCGTKGPGFKSQPQNLFFFGEFSKKNRKKQRNKMLRQILQWPNIEFFSISRSGQVICQSFVSFEGQSASINRSEVWLNGNCLVGI